MVQIKQKRVTGVESLSPRSFSGGESLESLSLESLSLESLSLERDFRETWDLSVSRVTWDLSL